MQDPVPDPPDAEMKDEFTFARLRYREFDGVVHPGRGGGRFGGRRRTCWGIDSNRADRLFEKAFAA